MATNVDRAPRFARGRGGGPETYLAWFGALICIVAAPEGLALLEAMHPDVTVYTPVVERELDARKFIVPGLGDFGDRLHGT